MLMGTREEVEEVKEVVFWPRAKAAKEARSSPSFTMMHFGMKRGLVDIIDVPRWRGHTYRPSERGKGAGRCAKGYYFGTSRANCHGQPCPFTQRAAQWEVVGSGISPIGQRRSAAPAPQGRGPERGSTCQGQRQVPRRSGRRACRALTRDCPLRCLPT